MNDPSRTPTVLVVSETIPEFAGRAEQTWDRILSRTFDPVLARSLTRTDFSHYESKDGAGLASYIRDAKPKAILALGRNPLQWLTGESAIEQLRGYIFNTPSGPVIPTYHPSYIMRGKWNLARVVQLDVLKALEVAREGSAKFLRPKAYELSPSYTEVRAFLGAWREAGKPPLAFDIETPYSGEAADNEEMTFEDDPSYTILMVSLAFEPFKAISMPWQEPYITLLKEAFNEEADFVVWNAKFDVPRLQANGVHFGGNIIDGMLAWHWLEPALPMGLKYVATFFCPDMGAWKLEMQKNFSWYNAADSDVLLRVFLGTRERLAAQGRWETFMRHFVVYGKILQKMSERGITVNHDARKAARTYFTERFDRVVQTTQAIAPTDILGIHPKRGYAKTPKDITGMVPVMIELTPQEEERLRKKAAREREKAREAAAKAARKAEKARLRAERERAKAERTAARAAKRKLKEAR